MQRQLFSLVGGLSIVGLTLAIGVLGGSGRAIAENGCPQGEDWFQNEHDVASSCQPIDDDEYYGDQGPQEVWADRWGAIAMGKNSEGQTLMSGVTDGTTERKAKKAAINDCRSRGGADCKVTSSYRNACIVLVWGDRGWNSNWRPSIQEAAEVATSTCNAEDTNCQITYSACSLAERIR